MASVNPQKKLRGTASQNAAVALEEGTIVYLTDTKQIAVHDGSTAGGTVVNSNNNTLENPTFTKGYTETVFTLTGTVLDPDNGTIQSKTLTANTIFSENLSSGESLFLTTTGSATYTITWPTMTWFGPEGNTAPTLSGTDAFVIWKEGTALKGAYIGNGD